MQPPEHGKVLGKRAGTPKKCREMCMRVWGTGEMLLVLWYTLVRVQPVLQHITVLNRIIMGENALTAMWVNDQIEVTQHDGPLRT
jgi:hypothetical protein